jgi:hypothetical protein
MPVQEAIEDTNPCRLADGVRNSGDGEFGMMLNIHTLIINELSMSSNPHTSSDRYGRVFSEADGPP